MNQSTFDLMELFYWMNNKRIVIPQMTIYMRMVNLIGKCTKIPLKMDDI